MRTFPIFILLLFCEFATAKNPIFAASLNQILANRFCANVKSHDLRCVGWKGSTKDIVGALVLSNDNVFDNLVFANSIPLQRDKNSCLIDRLSILKNDSNVFDIWYSSMVQSWLGLRKSQLILDKCQSFLNLESDRNARAEMQRRTGNPQPQRSNPIRDKWLPVCTPTALASLENAKKTFLHSTPVISSPDFFNIIGKNRRDIINNVTGKPITDDEILAMNLNENLNVRPMINGVKGDLIKKIDQLSLERQKINSELATAEEFGISDDTKDFMFKDGVIYEYLLDRKLITPSYLINPGASQIRNISNNGAACLLSKYEPTLTGSLVDFGFTSLLGGGLLLKVLKGQKFVSSLSSAQNFKKTFSTGVLATQLPILAGHLAKSCFAPEPTPTRPRTTSLSLVQHQAMTIPKEIGFNIFALDNKMANISSCNRDSDRDLMAGSFQQFQCLKSVAYAVTPLKISLPAMVALEGN